MKEYYDILLSNRSSVSDKEHIEEIKSRIADMEKRKMPEMQR